MTLPAVSETDRFKSQSNFWVEGPVTLEEPEKMTEVISKIAKKVLGQYKDLLVADAALDLYENKFVLYFRFSDKVVSRGEYEARQTANEIKGIVANMLKRKNSELITRFFLYPRSIRISPHLTSPEQEYASALREQISGLEDRLVVKEATHKVVQDSSLSLKEIQDALLEEESSRTQLRILEAVTTEILILQELALGIEPEPIAEHSSYPVYVLT